jgi:predicted PurR-regulated permease PerM
MYKEELRNQAILISFLGVVAVALWFFLRMVAPFGLALFMGGVLALILKPAYEFLIKKKFKPMTAAVLLCIALIILVLGPIAGFSVMAIKQGASLFQAFVAQENFSVKSVLDLIYNLPYAEDIFGTYDQMNVWLEQAVREGAQSFSTKAISFLAGIPSAVLQVLLALLTLCFLLIQGEEFVEWVFNKLPLQPEVETRVKSAFHNIAVAIVWASLAAATAQSLVMLIAAFATQIPGPFFAAGAVFILAWVPFVGSAPVWIAGTVFLASQGRIGMAVLMVVFGVLISVVDNFVRPLVLRGRDDMHPLLALIAIFGGVKLYGFFGVFVGPVAAAMVVALLDL